MTRKGLAVVAVGGNALIPDPKRPGLHDQFTAVAHSMCGVIDMVADGWDVVITHGNGPQVGFALRRSELAMAEVPPLPMDYADADTQGVIGYMFQRAIDNELAGRGITRRAATVVTQVLVDPDDPAMSRPSKPIGSYLTFEQARHAQTEGWFVARDADKDRGWRRVVPSPTPLDIVEFDAIRAVAAAGFIVIACGGGGIPVTLVDDQLCGVRAVIDKDVTASLLARKLDADLLLISTSVDRIALGFDTPQERWLDNISAEELARHHAAGEFAAGSMEPKVRAVVEFLAAGGKRAVISDPEHLGEAVAGRAGTNVAR